MSTKLEREQQVMNLINAQVNELSSRNVGLALGLTPSYSVKILRRLENRGLVESALGKDSSVTWATPELRRQKRLHELKEFRDGCRVKHHSVPAAFADRVKITAPISVFHLANI